MDWLGNLSKFLPGAQDMSEQDRTALVRQGLLAAGLGILSNNEGHYGKAGPAIGAGLSQGLLAMNKGADQLAENKYKQQYMAQQGGDPTQFRAMDMMARAAGHQPGTQGYQEFFKRANGEIARQSSAAIQYKEVIGSDGIPRLVAMDPREVGAQVVGGQQTTEVPHGPNPQQDFPMLAGSFGAQITSLQRTPEHNREVGGVPNSQHIAGTAGDFVVPPQAQQQFMATAQARGYQAINEGDHIHLELPPRPLASPKASGVNPFQGRRAEDQAAAVAAAQKAVELGALPTELWMQTNAAIQQAGGAAAASETAKNQADARNTLPKAIQQAEISLDTISKLERHPGLSVITGLSGKIDPRNYVPGSSAQGAIALADQLKGQTFLQAFQSLRGGGQITEVEGQKATDAMGRLNRAQSEKDYRAALGDLRGVIESGLRRARAQAGAATDQGAPSTNSTDPLGIL